MNEKQIQEMASKPEYALIRPSADELDAISDEVIQYSCECKHRYILSKQIAISLFDNGYFCKDSLGT